MTHKNSSSEELTLRNRTRKVRLAGGGKGSYAELRRQKIKLNRLGAKKALFAMIKAQAEVSTVQMAANDASAVPERQPISDYVKEAARFGVVADAPVLDRQLGTVLKAVAADSTDLFGSVAKAMSYLRSAPIDATGKKAPDVLKTAGIVPLLSRLDSLRYGPQG